MGFVERDFWFEREMGDGVARSIRLYGVLRVPQFATAEEPVPAVICCHPFAANHLICDPYAIALTEQGFATLALDFFGGGEGVRSDGTLLDMTVETERDDLLAALDAMANLDFVDGSCKLVLGCSQGGFVSAMGAAARPADVRALILMYPAFILHEDALDAYADEKDIPDSYTVMPFAPFDTTVSRAYNLAARRIDPYVLMGDYGGDVLIVHGTADPIVPLSYSRRAAKAYAHAQLERIEGGGHGFEGEALARSIDLAVAFAKQHA